jgi:5-methylcytosine-specific restriction endonuclease McrA
MPRNPWDIGFKPIKIKPIGFSPAPQKKKRKTLTSSQRIYIWERPNIYGRTCSICHRKITKLSDLELDHTKAHSKGGTRLALAHKDCNRLKSSGSLGKIQKTLGIKTKKRKTTRKKKTTKRKPSSPWDIKIPKFRI